MAITVAKLSEYMEHGLNIYIRGEAGTGKTQMLQAAAKKLGYSLGYMSAPTLDAYVDLVGIPVAKMDKKLKKKVLQFIRKKDFDDIEVLFVDELPRGELKTLNALFEVIQTKGCINGELALPNLKAVVAAGNPITEEYQGQQELDLALLDRFDIYLETSTDADLAYFINVFGQDTGRALVNWHKLHDHKEKGYLSPRRLEKIGHTWLKMPNIGTLKDMMPPSGQFDTNLLQRQLLDSVKNVKVQANPNASLADLLAFESPADVRSRRDQIIAELPNLSAAEVAKVTDAVSRSLMKAIQVKVIFANWIPVLEYFSPADEMQMMSNWTPSRNAEYKQGLVTHKVSVGKNLIGLK